MKLNFNKLFKNLFLISLIWLLIEGAVRKWLLFSLAGPLFYVKYLLFGSLYISFFFCKYPLFKLKYGYQFFILLFSTHCLIGFLVVTNENPAIVGVIGLIIHLLFLPLIHTCQYFFIKIEHIKRFLKILTYSVFPICVLGMIQFYLPVDHPINGFVNEEQLISRVDSFTRISSIFSFVKIYNAYLLFTVSILIGVILNKLLKRQSIFIESAAVLFLIVNMFMTGSRLPIGLMLLNFLIIGIYVFLGFSNLRKTVAVTFLLGFIGLSSLYFTTDLLNDPVDATISRFEKAESRHRTESTGFTDVKMRLEDRIDIFKFSKEAGWMGFGIGMAYQGSAAFIKKPIPFYFEEEGERIVLELGIIGGFIVIAMRLAILIFAIQILRWCVSKEIKLLLLPLVLYITPAVITIQNTTYSYMENFIYYLAIGLIIALYKIQQKQLENK